MRRGRRLLRLLAVGAFALASAGGAGSAQAAPETPVRIPGQAVYDLADVFDHGAEQGAENLADAIRSLGDADIVVVSEEIEDGASSAVAATRATTLRIALGVGAGTTGGGLLLYVGVTPNGCGGHVVLSADGLFRADILPDPAARSIVEKDLAPLLDRCDLDGVLLVGMGRVATAALDDGSGPDPADPAATPPPGGPGTVPAGPPFPDPVNGVAVYDHAGVLGADTIAAAERTADEIEARTGAEIVVYSQLVEDGRTTDQADRDAQALMDQWGVGRKGFDDGLVILFDMYPDRRHGQVILYAGPGFRATFLDNRAKQRIFEEDMLPRLRAGDIDGALLVALQRVDAAATPANAATLERARQIDAVLGLVVAPILALGLIASAAWSWLRYGRDPVYLDDPSIHMAGPPEALTPAGAVFVLEGHASRRALTTALLDVASRGHIAFREESGLLGIGRKVGITTVPLAPDPITRARQLRNDARPLGPAERVALERLVAIAADGDGYLAPDRLLEFGATVPDFDAALETEVVARGWFRERPSATVRRWVIRATLVGGGGIVATGAGLAIPFNGLLLIGVGLIAAAIVIGILARSMPAVSLPGAMIRAMLAAYRRTLKKTMDQARSMDQVVAEAGLAWLETPDQAVVWGTALGLHDEIEEVLGRTLEDTRAGRIEPGAAWLPAWYASSDVGSSAAAPDFAGAGAGSGGLFSSSAIPSIGGMFAALGSIGNAPSSGGGSDGGGSDGGGFSGGSSGGGGGGSGGGF